MQGKDDIRSGLTPLFQANGSVYPNAVKYYASVQLFSGWGLIRGNHKNPNPHAYSYLRSTGGGTVKMDNIPPSPYDAWYRVLHAYPTGLVKTFDPDLWDTCVDKINGKVRGDLDLSIDAFQARQTAKMFKAGELVTQFAKDIGTWDRRHKHVTYGVSKALARAIPIAKLAGALKLTWTYGWAPLLSDVYDILDETLHSYINQYQSYNGLARRTTSVVVAGQVDGSYGFTIPFITERRETCRIKVVLDTGSMPELARWTSLNPASIGWELLPFSFVVDWFFDVGSTLRSIESALLYNRAFKTGFVTRHLSYVGKSHGNTVGNSWSKTTAEGSWQFVSVDFDRSVLTSFPIRTLPRVKPPSSGQLQNGLALLTQFLSGRIKK